MTTLCNSNQVIEDLITHTLKTHLYFVKTYRFLKAGEENKTLAALSAYTKREPWTFSYSLESVISYERNKTKLFPELLDEIKTADTAYSPRLREIARNLLKNQTLQTTYYQQT